MVKLPWIPSEAEWLQVLEVFRAEPVRNRLMLALAYDAALRREELCSLRTDDLDPAHRTLRVRAETTKTRRERVVPYSAPTGVLLADYLRHRAAISRARGPLFLSESRRNHAEPLSLWSWSKVVRRVALAGGGSAVLHPHDPASVPDRPGPDGLGGARDRHLRRAPHDGLDAALYPPVRPGPGGEAEFLDDPDPRLAGADAHRARPRLALAGAAGSNAPGRPRTSAGRGRWSSGIEDRGWDRRASCSTVKPPPSAHRACGPAPQPGTGHPRRTARHWQAFSRLAEPLDAARAALHHDDDPSFRRAGAQAAAIVLQHCANSGRSYWAWTPWDWARHAVRRAQGSSERPGPCRPKERRAAIAPRRPTRFAGSLASSTWAMFKRPAAGPAGLRQRGVEDAMNACRPPRSQTGGATGSRPRASAHRLRELLSQGTADQPQPKAVRPDNRGVRGAARAPGAARSALRRDAVSAAAGRRIAGRPRPARAHRTGNAHPAIDGTSTHGPVRRALARNLGV